MQKKSNIEKITFKVVQMKFLAMHITNQKLSFDIFTVGNVLNIFMEHDLNILMILSKERLDNCDSCNVFLFLCCFMLQRPSCTSVFVNVCVKLAVMCYVPTLKKVTS